MDLRTLGETIAVTSVVLSLIFVGYELRLSRSIARSAEFVMAADVAESALALQATHADVWQRGCVGEELSAQDQVIFAKVYRAVVTVRFSGWARSLIGITEGRPEYWAFGTALDRYRFPGFNEMWLNDFRSRNANLSYETSLDSWGQAVEAPYTELLDSGPPKSISAGFCGL
jgi:hypothetical protein